MRAILVALILALLAGCTSGAPPPAAAPPPPPAASTPAAPPPSPTPEAAPEPIPVPIEVVEPTLEGPLAFTATLSTAGIAPARMDAMPKMAVTWRNVDLAATHSVVSDDGAFVGSGPIAPGGEFTFIFGYAGDFAYHCRYHPEMTGVVVVR